MNSGTLVWKKNAMAGWEAFINGVHVGFVWAEHGDEWEFCFSPRDNRRTVFGVAESESDAMWEIEKHYL